MMTETIWASRSPDDRYRTDFYAKGGQGLFAVAEGTAKGTLVTEFNRAGEVMDQVYYRSKAGEDALADFLGANVSVRSVKEYSKVDVSAECDACRSMKIGREMDFASPSGIEKVPVVPIYKCTGCGKRFYSMSDRYLGALVGRNEDLFEEKELGELDINAGEFMTTLNEYIIRIFASKKISRLVVKK